MFQQRRHLELLKLFENLGCEVWSCEYIIRDGTRPSWGPNTHIQKHMRIWTVLTRYGYCAPLLLSSQFHKMAYGNEEFTLCPFLLALRLNSELYGTFWFPLFFMSPFNLTLPFSFIILKAQRNSEFYLRGSSFVFKWFSVWKLGDYRQL